MQLAESQHRSKLIAFDPNVRLNVEPDLSKWRQRIQAMAQYADLIKVSSEDLKLLFAGEQIEETIERWHSCAVRLVIVTRGEAGAIVSLDGNSFEVAGKAVTVMDTVGAGDSFQAGLLCGLDEIHRATKSQFKNITLEDCRKVVRFANESAAESCTRRGADLPHRSDLPTL